jgi:hypothetical protein
MFGSFAYIFCTSICLLLLVSHSKVSDYLYVYMLICIVGFRDFGC